MDECADPGTGNLCKHSMQQLHLRTAVICTGNAMHHQVVTAGVQHCVSWQYHMSTDLLCSGANIGLGHHQPPAYPCNHKAVYSPNSCDHGDQCIGGECVRMWPRPCVYIFGQNKVCAVYGVPYLMLLHCALLQQVPQLQLLHRV
jgi:hypothetical protein